MSSTALKNSIPGAQTVSFNEARERLLRSQKIHSRPRPGRGGGALLHLGPPLRTVPTQDEES